MAEPSQARAERRAPETEISVDLAESDATKAVTRRAKPSNIAATVRDDHDHDGVSRRSPEERSIFKRMSRFQKNISKQFDQKLADQEARHQQEIAELRKKYEGVSVERQGDAEAATAHERAMLALQEKLAAANEKGDSAEAARITAEMIRADGAYHAKISGAKQRADTTGTATQATQQTQTPRPKGAGPTPAGSRFILANEEWWEDPDFAIEKQAASTIYLELMNNEGYEANSDETFTEVAKRLKAKFRDLPVIAGKRRGAEPDPDEDEDDDEEGARQQPSRRRAPAASMQDRGTASGQRNRGERRTLSSEERATMLSVGLSPDNDRDLVQFLREAVAMEASA